MTATYTNYFVDPTVASDGGSGTLGSPWTRADGQVVQYAADNITPDAVNGDCIHVKVGTPHTNWSAAFDSTTYIPTTGKPLTIRGYNSAAEDGGICDLNLGGNALFAATTYSDIKFIDCEIHNFGTNQLHGQDRIAFINCHIHDCNYTGNYSFDLNQSSLLLNCYIEDMDGSVAVGGVILGGYSSVVGCFIKGASNRPLLTNSIGCNVIGNIVKVNNTGSYGIWLNASTQLCIGNSVYNSTAGTTCGIYVAQSSSLSTNILDNIIEGWSGGGTAAAIWSYPSQRATILRGNRAYNCTSLFRTGYDDGILVEDNSTLAASAFTDPSSDDFTVSDEVKGAGSTTYIGGTNITSTPNYTDTGAAQREEAAGGGGSGTTFYNPFRKPYRFG